MIRRPQTLVLVRHAQSARNVAKKGNAFFLDDESRKAVQGIPDQHVPITDEGRRQAELTGAALERWTHDEFLERWDAELVPNCAVTTYAFDAALGRLTLRTLNAVHWRTG
jgi:hypothetical protein